LTTLSQDHQIIIMSGGLGPTTDDLTREAVSQFFGCDLAVDNEAKAQVYSYYQKKGRSYDDSNVKQISLPTVAKIITNPIGSAPGFFVEHNQLLVISLPGVPRELELMLKETALKLITDN